MNDIEDILDALAFCFSIHELRLERVNANVVYAHMKGEVNGYKCGGLYMVYGFREQRVPTGTIKKNVNNMSQGTGRLWVGDGCRGKCTCGGCASSPPPPARLYGEIAWPVIDPGDDKDVLQKAEQAFKKLAQSYGKTKYL